MLSALFVTETAAHGDMVFPHTWFQPNGEGALEPFNQCGNNACMWFTNYTHVDKRTMPADSAMRTYPVTDPTYQIFGSNPWAAPGSAFVNSPCGTFGGNPKGCPAGDAGSDGQECPGGGYGFGPDARLAYNAKADQLGAYFGDKALTDIMRTEVEAGGTLDVNWVPQANHGGGYAYRLCKVPEDGDMTKLTEECFQEGHLDFASDESWIQWGPDKKDSVKFQATRSSDGTVPKGSTWTKDPIPVCADPAGGILTENGNACSNIGGKTQFKPPVPGIQGYGLYIGDGGKFETDSIAVPQSLAFTVGDTVKIPENLEAGNYVLSWRWDCEQTPQVWFTCADISITSPAAPAPTREPASAPTKASGGDNPQWPSGHRFPKRFAPYTSDTKYTKTTTTTEEEYTTYSSKPHDE